MDAGSSYGTLDMSANELGDDDDFTNEAAYDYYQAGGNAQNGVEWDNDSYQGGYGGEGEEEGSDFHQEAYGTTEAHETTNVHRTDASRADTAIRSMVTSITDVDASGGEGTAAHVEEMVTAMRAVAADGMQAKAEGRTAAVTAKQFTATMTEAENLATLEEILKDAEHLTEVPLSFSILSSVERNHNGRKGTRNRVALRDLIKKGTGVDEAALVPIPIRDQDDAFEYMTTVILKALAENMHPDHPSYQAVRGALLFILEPEKFAMAPVISTLQQVWKHTVDTCERNRPSVFETSEKVIEEMALKLLSKGGTKPAGDLWANEVATAIEGMGDTNGTGGEMTQVDDQKVTMHAVSAARGLAHFFAWLDPDDDAARRIFAAVASVYVGKGSERGKDAHSLATAMMAQLAPGAARGLGGEDEARQLQYETPLVAGHTSRGQDEKTGEGGMEGSSSLIPPKRGSIGPAGANLVLDDRASIQGEEYEKRILASTRALVALQIDAETIRSTLDVVEQKMSVAADQEGVERAELRLRHERFAERAAQLQEQYSAVSDEMELREAEHAALVAGHERLAGQDGTTDRGRHQSGRGETSHHGQYDDMRGAQSDASGSSEEAQMESTARRMYGTLGGSGTRNSMLYGSSTSRRGVPPHGATPAPLRLAQRHTDRKAAARAATRLQRRGQDRLQFVERGWVPVMTVILAEIYDVEAQLEKAQTAGTHADKLAIARYQRFQKGVSPAAMKLLIHKTKSNENAIDEVLRLGGTSKFNAPRATRPRGGQRRGQVGGISRRVTHGNRGTSATKGRSRILGQPPVPGHELRIMQVQEEVEAGGHHHGGEQCNDEMCYNGSDAEAYIHTNIQRCYTCGCNDHHRHRDQCPWDRNVNDAQPQRKRLAPDGSETMCYKCGEVGKKGTMHIAPDCPNPPSCMEKQLNPDYGCDGHHATRECPARRKSNSAGPPLRSFTNDRGGGGGGRGSGGQTGGKGRRGNGQSQQP